MSDKPYLRKNSKLPLGNLSDNSFEDFVYQSLVLLGDHKKFSMQSGRQPSADGGFDCTARKLPTQELICIQCKRYTKTLYTATVVEEIVKVALNGALDNTTPKHHYIITSGDVSQLLRKQLRQEYYSDLKAECKKLLDENKVQVTLIKKTKKNSLIPYDVICNYIDSLNNLIVWSRVDFQNELVVIWSKISDILEKHFSLDVVFKEHPRPDFDISLYIKNKINKDHKLIPLQYQQSELPAKLQLEGSLINDSEFIWSIDDVISCLKNENNILISSIGGSGKSSTLSIIEEKLLYESEGVKYVSIKINLRSYSRNTLKQRIDQELSINYGSWNSLPFKFIFLFDGLDEMPDYETQAFMDELYIIQGYNFLLTLRSVGLNVDTVLPLLDYCLSIKPLSYRSAFEIAEKTFSDGELTNFYNEYRTKLTSIGFNFLSLPFVLSMTIEYYKRNSNFPLNIEAILEDWIDSKIKHDSRKVKSISTKLNKIPLKYIKEAFSLILYKSRIEKNMLFIPEADFHDLITECFDELEISNSFITRFLDIDEFISMITHYEILSLGSDNHYSTPHSIISDYLISITFANNWQSHKDTHLLDSLHDVWLNSCHFVKSDERDDFLSLILSFNLCLGAKVSKVFGDKYIQLTEKILLLEEQNNAVLRRHDAVYALGLLGTNESLKRLRSTDDCIDEHHSWHRQASLAEIGDKKTLMQILHKNEPQLQAPIEISGGTISLWFNSSPAVITEIAKARLEEGLKNKNIQLCHSLETIGLFGDSDDIENLLLIAEQTENKKEFYKACHALKVINKESLIQLLNEFIDKKHYFSYDSKRFLMMLGLKSDISDEFNYFIKKMQTVSEEHVTGNHIQKLSEFSDFIIDNGLSEDQVSKLINFYKTIDYDDNFYLIWKIASELKIISFMDIVEFAFIRKKSSEINNALDYLSQMDELSISKELTNKIDEYFKSVKDDNYGLKLNYAKYYLSRNNKKEGYRIIFETLDTRLAHLTPERVDHNQYYISHDFDYINFRYLDVVKDLELDDSLSLKVLLTDTSCTPQNDKVKQFILTKTDAHKIEAYTSRIIDESVRVGVYADLLDNNIIEKKNIIDLIEKYLPAFLSHHRFFAVIKKVSEAEWNDKFASIFLSCFLKHNWTDVGASMFEKDIEFYAKKLTKEQLIKFEKERELSIDPLVDRIYKIWLEYNRVN